MTQETLTPIVFAPADFRWAGEIAEELPIVNELDGSICEPLLRFFGWSFRMRRVKISSMRDEAYTLREWWSHLRACGVSWEQATDQTMIVWREALKRPSDGGKAASPERINRKLAIVFEFYLSAKQALLTPYDMVGPDLAITPRRDDPTRWSSSEKSRRNTVRRKTPDIEAVGIVLTHLRNTAVNPALKDRNWLIGRTMADAGLRRDESSRLGRRMILDAIFKEGMRSKGDAATGTQGEHQAALEALDRLEARSRTNIYVRVVGKGDVVREAPFPIALVRDLLTILGKPTGKRNQDWLFVSDKTGARLSAEAIGNMMLDAFDACGIDGSGHRLRAHFATKLAERLWAEEFANNGFRWDQRVENLVLDRVAEALGHASPTTSCRHYLDLGRMAYFRVDTKSALKAMRSAVSAMADNHRKLPTEFFDRIRMLLERRASGVAALDDIIDAILADPDYAATEAEIRNDASSTRPNLRIV
jgi:integrase